MICAVCDSPIVPHEGAGSICTNPSCRAPWRGRSLAIILDGIEAPVGGRALAFSSTWAERTLAARKYPHITSVTLYGDYGPETIMGVDARDLSGYSDMQFDLVYAVSVYDYFVEIDAAVSEAARVLKPHGVLAICMNKGRFSENDMPPKSVLTVRKGERNFNYLPEDATLEEVKVGKQWMLNCMNASGFDAAVHELADSMSTRIAVWFTGRKR